MLRSSACQGAILNQTTLEARLRGLLHSTALGAALFAQASTAEAPAGAEPTLIEAQAAAGRVAAGEPSDDASRLFRARAAHWAPVVRGQVGIKDDSRLRDGVYRDAPVRLNDTGQSLSWGFTLTWDLPQAIFARDETQLAHSRLHLSRARLQAASETARLFLERREKRRALDSAALGARTRLLLEVIRATAELDARTDGLFRAALEREEASLASLLGTAASTLPPAALRPVSAAQTPERR